MKRWVASALVLVLSGGRLARGQDVLAFAQIEALPGQTRDVAVNVRDLAGTLLDEGDGFALEIQGFAFRLDFAPAEHVVAVTFVQAGVTAGHTPIFPVVNPQPDHIVVLMSFDETADPLGFTLSAPPPGDRIGVLRFTLAAAVPLGTQITLEPVVATAALVNGAATLEESVANGHLELIAGSILIDAEIFSGDFETGGFAGWSQVVGG